MPLRGSRDAGLAPSLRLTPSAWPEGGEGRPSSAKGELGIIRRGSRRKAELGSVAEVMVFNADAVLHVVEAALATG